MSCELLIPGVENFHSISMDNSSGRKVEFPLSTDPISRNDSVQPRMDTDKHGFSKMIFIV
jgi:hypothetical protein